MKAPLFWLLKELTTPPFVFLPASLLLPIPLLLDTITLVGPFHLCSICAPGTMLCSTLCVTLPFSLPFFSIFSVSSFLLFLSLPPSTHRWCVPPHIVVGRGKCQIVLTIQSIDDWGCSGVWRNGTSCLFHPGLLPIALLQLGWHIPRGLSCENKCSEQEWSNWF